MNKRVAHLYLATGVGCAIVAGAMTGLTAVMWCAFVAYILMNAALAIEYSGSREEEDKR